MPRKDYTTIRVTKETRERIEDLKPYDSVSNGEIVAVALEALAEREREAPRA